MVYAIHPGIVRSQHDRDEHYIGAPELVRLYGLKSGEYVVWDVDRPETYRGREWGAYRHLFPRSKGDYSL